MAVNTSVPVFLRRTFPEFEDYVRHVPSMFPKVTPHSHDKKESPAGFSLELYLKHREYNALLGALAEGRQPN